MRCREHEDTILDVARGVAGEREAAALLRHAEECPACAARLRRERALTAGLRALDAARPGEGASPGVEAALLAAFASRQSSAPGVKRAAAAKDWRPWLAAAAVVTLVASGTVLVLRDGRGPRPEGRPALIARPLPASQGAEMLRLPVEGQHARLEISQAAGVATPVKPSAPAGGAAPGAFVPWPGAAALPAFENGELVRTELPASVLPLLGIAGASPAAGETVAVDVVVGQDGFARAVRLAR